VRIGKGGGEKGNSRHSKGLKQTCLTYRGGDATTCYAGGKRLDWGRRKGYLSPAHHEINMRGRGQVTGKEGGRRPLGNKKTRHSILLRPPARPTITSYCLAKGGGKEEGKKAKRKPLTRCLWLSTYCKEWPPVQKKEGGRNLPTGREYSKGSPGARSVKKGVVLVFGGGGVGGERWVLWGVSGGHFILFAKERGGGWGRKTFSTLLALGGGC